MILFKQQSSKYADKHACSFVGFGESTLSLMQALYQYPKKKFQDLDYTYNYLHGHYEWYDCSPVVDNAPQSSSQSTLYQFHIWRVGEHRCSYPTDPIYTWNAIDEYVYRWTPRSILCVVIAILPKQKAGERKREMGIINLRKLHEAGMCIYLIDEEKVDGEEAICREICRLTDGLLTIFCGENEMALSYADCASVFEEGFIYCAQSENYKLEKAFDVRQLVRVSGISDKVPVAVDRALLFIQCSYENELQPRQMEYIQEQFKWVNTHREIKWGFGYKDEGENDNFHSYAFFAQKKFPDYLKSNSVSCSGMERIQHCTVMRKMIDGK